MTREELRKEATMTVEWECTPITGSEPREKRIAELEKEKCELLGIIQGKDKVIQELKKELNSMLVSKNQQH